MKPLPKGSPLQLQKARLHGILSFWLSTSTWCIKDGGIRSIKIEEFIEP